MARKSKTKIKKFEANEGNWAKGDAIEVSIPDEAVYYIVSNYLQNQTTPGIPVVVGISTQTVEDILQLLVDWSARSGHIKDGVINIGIPK
jgi:hypothetical protein